MNTLGYVHACIGGDHRYSTELKVFLRDDLMVEVVRSENGAVGGMDGPGGATPYGVRATETVEPDGKLVIRAIKRLMDRTIKEYGKPTKNFTWYLDGGDRKGLSAALATAAIERAISRREKGWG